MLDRGVARPTRLSPDDYSSMACLLIRGDVAVRTLLYLDHVILSNIYYVTVNKPAKRQRDIIYVVQKRR